MNKNLLILLCIVLAVAVSGCISGNLDSQFIPNCKYHGACFEKYLRTCEPAIAEFPPTSGIVKIYKIVGMEGGKCKIIKIIDTLDIRFIYECYAEPNQTLGKYIIGLNMTCGEREMEY